ncbi:MAG: hypothetical protein HY760_09200, partial [Nitrospirae bacterium]|nr:hypothetical protein [Nitrospirota bacterium]
QVLQHVTAHYGVGFDQVPAFLSEKFPAMEDYEVDLILSPIFTPRLDDQARFSDLLEENTVSPDELNGTVSLLSRKGLRTTLRYGGETLSLPLHSVSISRYVRLLNLDAPVSRNLFQRIDRSVPAHERQRVKALARDRAWQRPEHEAIFTAFLEAFQERGTFAFEKVEFLTGFVRTNRPGSIREMADHLDHLIDAYKNDEVGQKFYDIQLKQAYAEAEIVKPGDHRLESARMHTLDLLREIREDLQHILGKRV